jgi:hypothetical protein
MLPYPDSNRSRLHPRARQRRRLSFGRRAQNPTEQLVLQSWVRSLLGARIGRGEPRRNACSHCARLRRPPSRPSGRHRNQRLIGASGSISGPQGGCDCTPPLLSSRAKPSDATRSANDLPATSFGHRSNPFRIRLSCTRGPGVCPQSTPCRLLGLVRCSPEDYARL